MSKYCTQARMQARSGTRCELANVLLDAARLLSGANGCKVYFVSISPTEPDSVWVTEVWDSEEAYRASFSIPGVKELYAIGRTLVSVPEGKTTMIPLGGKGVD